MTDLIQFLNSPAFSVLGSPASWAELVGAVLGIAMVVCNIKQIHWAWPLAFASSALYFFVFWDSKLFGDASLQIFFALMALWGWWQWLRGVQKDGEALTVQTLSNVNAIKLIAISGLLWLAVGLFLLNFTTTDVPWWDAFPTSLSLVATFLLGRKYLENWPTWIVVNLVSIALFAYKGLWLTVGLYIVFAAMAFIGWQAWRKHLAAQSQE
ncbi:MAG TPA: nicotinamide riboside transporter PnuC [Burkholderiaceae bacterium]|nr:nicotinamide riboside transporter PnuC [Burkholderiaceae bacterium]